jgi:hypothetical protein
MADKKFIIEVRTKGFAKANRDVGKLDKSSKSYEKTAGKMRGTTNGLQGSIGALRNRILVYTFAIGGAVAVMNKFVKAASGFQDVKTRLVGLTGSVKEAEIAFDAFNQIAATTPFALDDVVNAGAQLQAFGVDAKQTLSATTDLAAFMGTTAVEAASALGRAFAGGAGAADILREKGILQLVKDSQGIKDLTKITLPEFRQALLRAMVDPVAGIQGSSKRLSKTFTGAVSNMNDAVTRFAALIGDKLLPGLTGMANQTEAFFRALDLKKVAEFTTALGAVATVILLIKNRTLLLASAAALATGGLNLLLGSLALFVTHWGIKASGVFNNLTTATTTANTSQQNLTQSTKRYIKTLKSTGLIFAQSVELQKAMADVTEKTYLIFLQNQGMDSKRLQSVQMMFDAEKLLTEILGDRVTVDKEAIIASGDFIVNLKDATQGEAEYLAMVVRSVKEQKIKIENMKEQINVAGALSSALQTAFDPDLGAGEAFKGFILQLMSAMQGVILASKAVSEALTFTFTGPIGVGAAIASIIALEAAKAGVRSIKFAETGFDGVVNKPTMFMTGESGPERVSVLPLTPGMNQNGPSGSINISINGGIVDESYVRNELIPALNRATSLGATLA